MPTPKAARFEFFDFHPQPADFHQEVVEGLRRYPKRVSPKFFYDKRGSELFDQICELEEYYPTRTEVSILEHNASAIAERFGPECSLIEYGSGSSRKVRILLDAVGGRLAYTAIDISKEHLIQSASELADSYPELEVIAVCADYTKPFPLPKSARYPDGRKVVFFPGSTIGNFNPPQSREFLANTARQVGPGGSMLIGVDLKKDERVLHDAYNDAEGVTAAFNLNLLERMNSELGAGFDLSAFRHRAFYNQPLGRVEMHLESLKTQQIPLNGTVIKFEQGETIHTENSYKYSIPEFQQLAAEVGFHPERVWTDPERLFSLHYLRTPA